MTPGPHSIDDDKIRARCASPEAADYTLYVRNLVREFVPGGQAEILRIATERGLLPTGYTRQTLSEHLSGRYRHGPPWSTTDMIIKCLPERAPKPRIRDEATALYRVASRRPTLRRNTADLAWPEVSPAGSRWDYQFNAVPGRHAGPDVHRPLNTHRVAGGGHPGANASSLAHRHGAYRPGTHRPGVHRIAGTADAAAADVAAEIAELRAECARLTVQVALARDPHVTPARYTDLSASFASYQRSRLGQLADRIDPTAPLMRRLLARYLCAYAELGQTPINELAVRTGLRGDTVADLLAARRLPTESELSGLSAVLGADGEMVRHLAAQARSEAGTRRTEDRHTGPG